MQSRQFFYYCYERCATRSIWFYNQNINNVILRLFCINIGAYNAQSICEGKRCFKKKIFGKLFRTQKYMLIIYIDLYFFCIPRGDILTYNFIQYM